MFRDECEIEVRAGKGGAGLVSFHREKFVPKGGPDGGDGGRGGSVVLVARAQIRSLLELGRRPIYSAADGRPGGVKNKSGADASDLELAVPVGTQVFDAERGNLLRDLAREGERLLAAQGGRGGQGNARFANAVRQAPRFAQSGEAGEQRRLRLELKLFADVGLLGLPNAGKSTFLSRVSAATPKIADYPFTTLVPQVGIAALPGERTLCIADLPGLIEGASQGAGLGHKFLKHVERCRVLLQLVDVSSAALVEPQRAFEIVDAELARTSSELCARPRVVAATKCESETDRAAARELSRALARPVLALSSHTGEGVSECLEALDAVVRQRSPAGQAG
jgi:GTP-binding protein